MASVKLKNGLKNYLNRLQAHKGNYDANKIYESVSSLGIQTAQDEYNKTGVIPDNIRADVFEGGVEIVAEGEHLAFSEYGTGVRGEGTYDGELPTETLRFESPQGVDRETQGWTYDYMKKLYNPEKESFQGFVARAQMWKTSRRLQEEMPNKVKKELKGD